MDLLQLLMQRFGDVGGDFDDVIEKYTNKNFLIEQHDGTLRSQASFENSPADLFHFNTTTTTEIKSSAPVPLNSKNRITLDDLLKSIDVPVTGKFLLCRSICPPVKFTALTAIVDDPNGKLAVRIGLYNFVRNMSHRLPNEIYQYLPVGTILAIMNPWFKKTADGGLTIRCDNPAEVVILNQAMVKDIIGCLPWQGDIPMKYRRKELKHGVDSAFDWRVSGNEHFYQKRFHDAIQAYTNGISAEKSSAKNKLDLLANRSAAYLALQKYKLGLVDAESVLLVDNTHIKCIFRKAKALFGLAEYQNALDFLTSLSPDTLPDKKVIGDLIVKAKSLIAQSQTGDYPWVEVYQNQFDELAEFVGPVIVKNTPTKGRGLFATDVIKAGQLILASKAFAHIVVNPSPDFFVKLHRKGGQRYMSDRAQTQLITEIAHILKENPEKCREVYNLYAGPELNKDIGPIDTHGCDIDMQRIEAICWYNLFGSSNLRIGIDNEKERHCGLWLAPSYINHSCVDGNSSWYWKKDFLFVTAFRDIAKDEEILIAYVPIGQKTQKALEKYDFVCDCRLCIRDLQDNSTVETKRSDLISRFDAIAQQYIGDGRFEQVIRRDITEDVRKMTVILKSLSDLRKDAPELNLSYVDKMETVASIYFRNGQYSKSVRTLEQVYSLIADLPVFLLWTATISRDIVGTYTILGELEKVKEWIPVFKRNCVLAYGTWKVIEIAFPLTYKGVQALGISLDDM